MPICNRRTPCAGFRWGGFTLIELMLAVAILAIILSIGIPSYRNYVQETRRTEGRNVLLNTAQRLERCFSTYGSYNNDNCGIINGGSLANDIASEEGRYVISAVNSSINASTFDLVAEPQGDQANDDCGDLTLDETGAKGAATGTVDECW